MSKFSQWKEAIKNPPEERLCQINANAYKLNIMGIIVVILFLINFGIWYVGLIFVFNTIINWVGYKRETKQLRSIVEAKKAMGVYKTIEEDISFSRKRFRTISEHLGEWVKYVIIAKVTVILFFLIDPATRHWSIQVLFVIAIIFMYLLIYLFPVYWLAKWRMKRKNG